MLNGRIIYQFAKSRGNIGSLRTYLSQEYKILMEQPTHISKIDTDTKTRCESDFLDFMYKKDISKEEIYHKVMKLRSSKNATLVSEAVSHFVVRTLLPANNDLLSILANKQQYGIFLDRFQACYLMDFFLENNNFSGAAQIAAELMVQEDCENELTQALSFLSCFGYVKNSLNEMEEKQHEMTEKEKSDKPQKVRVKFVRNAPEHAMIQTSNLTFELIGKTILEFSQKCSRNDLKKNGSLLANILIGELKNAEELLNSNENIYCKDMLQLCSKILETQKYSDSQLLDNVKNILEKLMSTSKSTYEKITTEFVEESKSKNESVLMSEELETYEKCKIRMNQLLEDIEKSKTKNSHQSNIEKTIADIQLKKQQLWFFETEEKLDLEMYRKKVHYPKRWFGKKKKPKAVDDGYIPPEIRVK